MDLKRVITSTIVRRLTLLALAALLAWLGLGEARAQTALQTACPSNKSPLCTRQEAYEDTTRQLEGACTARNASWTAHPPSWNYVTYSSSYDASYSCKNAQGDVINFYATIRAYHGGCPVDKPWNEALKICGNGCDTKPPLGEGSGTVPSNGNLGFPASDPNGCPITTCSDSCEFAQPSSQTTMRYLVIDGVAHCMVSGWVSTGASCSPGVGGVGPAPSAPPTDSDGDGTSDGNDSAPNNPGQGGGGGENGEGQPEDGSGTCGEEGQPACGSPGTGSGNGNTSGGGQDCNTPPSSTGDAILAQIAYQTWATRCAITGMGNAGPGNGTGNGDGSGEGTGGEFDGDAEGRDAATEGDSEDPEREDVVEEPETEEPELDTSGYGYSRACVAAPTVTVFGQTITFDTGPMCQWLELASYFVLVLAGLASARIINGGMA